MPTHKEKLQSLKAGMDKERKMYQHLPIGNQIFNGSHDFPILLIQNRQKSHFV